jgi:signal transduction histidine kinase
MAVKAEDASAGSFARSIEHVPTAFAVTSGDRHTLIYANAEFRDLVARDGRILLGVPIADAIPMRDTAKLTALLDRSLRAGVVSRNVRVGLLDDGSQPMSCTVWPDLVVDDGSTHLVIELREETPARRPPQLEREIVERLLMSALREQDAADLADEQRARATYLAVESRQLSESLDETETLAVMRELRLPSLDAWCVVDTFSANGTMLQVTIPNIDPAKQLIMEKLESRWHHTGGGAVDLLAIMHNGLPWAVPNNVGLSLVTSSEEANDVSDQRAHRALGIGPLLTVPMHCRGKLLGALTFVGAPTDRSFSPQEIELALDLANRAASSLDRARAYGEVVALKVQAEAASEAKSSFLGMMSHELRTPLNAIGGYVDIIDLGLHGPVTEAQHHDLERIRSSNQYLTRLITDLLNLTRVSNGLSVYDHRDVSMQDVLDASLVLLEPLFATKSLVPRVVMHERRIIALADREKVIQILINLLTNGVKFSSADSQLDVLCEATPENVVVRISDRGIGIPHDKLDAIFDPFVQVPNGFPVSGGGVGLGLAISRALARGMHGDITVESTLGAGSCFTLTLPRERRSRRSAFDTLNADAASS